MHRTTALRAIALGSYLLALAAGCSSSHATAAVSTTTASTTTSTTDPDLTPNSIPYSVGERMGLPHGWLVTVVRVHKAYAHAGLHPVPAGQQYIAVDITMDNQGSAAHTVDADRLFTIVDGSHNEHIVVPEPGTANGIDGAYPPGTTHSGRLVFVVPTAGQLGLILYGPRIGTQVSYFMVDPPAAPG